MGANNSQAKNQPDVPYVLLTWQHNKMKSDKLHLFNADDEVMRLVHKNLSAFSLLKDDSPSRVDDVYEFAVKDKSDAVPPAMCKLIEEMFGLGYLPQFSAGLNWVDKQNTIYFYKSDQHQLNKERTTGIQVSAVDLTGCEMLTAYNLSESENGLLKSAVGETCGLEEAKSVSNTAYSLKLAGSPWKDPSAEDDVKGKQLILRVLSAMATRGWTLLLSSLTSGTQDTLYFARVANVKAVSEQYSSPESFTCVELRDEETLRLYTQEDQVVEAMRAALKNSWTEGIQAETRSMGCVEFKLQGTPWTNRVENCVKSVELVCDVLGTMRKSGWKVIGNTITDQVDHYHRVLGSFFFTKAEPNTVQYAALAPRDQARMFAVNFDKPSVEVLAAGSLPKFFEVKEEESFAGGHSWSFKGSVWSTMKASAERFQGQMCVAVATEELLRDTKYNVVGGATVSNARRIMTNQYGSHLTYADCDAVFYAMDEPCFNMDLLTGEKGLPSDYFSQ